MYESLLDAIEQAFPKRPLLKIEEVMEFLACDRQTIYNWNKRPDPKRRPPSISVGKELRFPKQLFAKWLADEQSRLN